MRGNVTSDWWHGCERCGRIQHASEGACSCEDFFNDLDDCFCGQRVWIVKESVVLCALCNTEPNSYIEETDV